MTVVHVIQPTTSRVVLAHSGPI